VIGKLLADNRVGAEDPWRPQWLKVITMRVWTRLYLLRATPGELEVS